VCNVGRVPARNGCGVFIGVHMTIKLGKLCSPIELKAILVNTGKGCPNQGCDTIVRLKSGTIQKGKGKGGRFV